MGLAIVVLGAIFANGPVPCAFAYPSSKMAGWPSVSLVVARSDEHCSFYDE
jgi:hypothetical protein